MTIEYFADQQNLVFVPALLALLLATVLICTPIVFAPALRHGRRSGRRALLVVAGVVAAGALVVAGWQAGVGVRTLQAERASTTQQLQQRYGLELTDGQVGELINGGAPQVALPDRAAALDLKPTGTGRFPLELQRAGRDAYRVTYGGEVLPPTA